MPTFAHQKAQKFSVGGKIALHPAFNLYEIHPGQQANAIKLTLSQISFEIRFKSSFNQLFWFELSRLIYSSQQYDKNSEKKFDSELKFDQKNIEINRKLSSSIKNVKINQ